MGKIKQKQNNDVIKSNKPYKSDPQVCLNSQRREILAGSSHKDKATASR